MLANSSMCEFVITCACVLLSVLTLVLEGEPDPRPGWRDDTVLWQRYLAVSIAILRPQTRRDCECCTQRRSHNAETMSIAYVVTPLSTPCVGMSELASSHCVCVCAMASMFTLQPPLCFSSWSYFVAPPSPSLLLPSPTPSPDSLTSGIVSYALPMCDFMLCNLRSQSPVPWCHGGVMETIGGGLRRHASR